MTLSSATVYIKDYDIEYRFSGVTSIRHSLTLKIAQDTDSTEGQDYVNGARVQPNKLTLSVIESEAGSYAARPSDMLEALDRVRRARVLCTVTVSGKVYDNMLLSDLTVVQDDQTPCGWTGTLTFTQATMISTVIRNDNSSRSTYIGNGSTTRISSDEKKNAAEINRLLERAGITV